MRDSPEKIRRLEAQNRRLKAENLKNSKIIESWHQLGNAFLEDRPISVLKATVASREQQLLVEHLAAQGKAAIAEQLFEEVSSIEEGQRRFDLIRSLLSELESVEMDEVTKTRVRKALSDFSLGLKRRARQLLSKRQ